MEKMEIDNLFATFREISKIHGGAAMRGKPYPKQKAEVHKRQDGYFIVPLKGCTNLRFFVNDKGGKIFDTKSAETYHLDHYEASIIKTNYLQETNQ